jgi:DNA excision repair protein ERCC-4
MRESVLTRSLLPPIQVERVMKALGLRRLFLYPRFQSQVRTCLEKRAIDVVELEQDLSPAMEAVQDSLVLMIGDCVKV